MFPNYILQIVLSRLELTEFDQLSFVQYNGLVVIRVDKRGKVSQNQSDVIGYYKTH